MLLEIFITTIITIILVFIGCLVLGLQISSIKSTLTSQQKVQETTINTLTSVEQSLQKNIYSLSNAQLGMNKKIFSQGVDIYNTQEGLNKFQNLQKDQIKTVNNLMNSNVSLQLGIEKANIGLSNVTSGKTEFTALKVGPATISRNIKGDLMIDTSATGGIVFNASNASLPIDGSCLQIGMGKLCNNNNTFFLSGNINTSNLGVSDLRFTSQEGMLSIQDKNGMPRGVILNGIKQTMPGSMIEYNGYGIGEYGNGNIRTYAPTKPTSQISMSFKNPDSTFKDVLSVKNDGLKVNGNVTISGNIMNDQMAQIKMQAQQAQLQAARAITIASNALATLQETQRLRVYK